MARITVEDCLEHVDNRFDLVLLAARRARQIAQGADPLVEPENDKPTVIALREIAENLISKTAMDEMEAQHEMERITSEDVLVREIAQASLAGTRVDVRGGVVGFDAQDLCVGSDCLPVQLAAHEQLR